MEYPTMSSGQIAKPLRGNAPPPNTFELAASPNSPKTPNATRPKSKPCEMCDAQDKFTWHCSYCDMMFCAPCWDIFPPHKPGRTGPDGLAHEKADVHVVERLKDILTPAFDVSEQTDLHLDDEDTTWFGVDRDSNQKPVFQDYGRYATIMADSSTGEFQVRYPQLVSFIGQTGAGKSTLIKMLIDQQERRSGASYRLPFASPIAGSQRTGNVPTSGDVHLYGDPGTLFTQQPMLYADCEGLEGGENMPMSLQFKHQFHNHHKDKSRRRSESSAGSHKHKSITKLKPKGTPRDLSWATSSEKKKREYAVTQLYPRLLYTFSDTIVFVLRNAKTFESSVLSKLLEWGVASIEKSLNQPTLPHVIIAVNATEMEVDPREWEPSLATASLMYSVSKAVNNNPRYRDRKEYWEAQGGKTIQTTQDLLECYYSSITVVRIPIKGRYMKIDEQVQKLHDIITERCAQSFKSKRRSRMLSNSEELNIYLQSAFDHFSTNLDTPFNFMDVAFRINPIPLDFGGNILKLAVQIRKTRNIDNASKIFQELSFMVASCILLDCSRQGLKGPADQLLERGYQDFCDNALEDFCAFYWPCAFRTGRGRCVNVREGHYKGHQNESGTVIGKGPYQSDFAWESFVDDWTAYLQRHLADMQRTLQNHMQEQPNLSEIAIASRLHRQNVTWFYRHLGGAKKFVSHCTCFCCLREIAEHPLPCGHVLCKRCIKDYGVVEDHQVTLSTCPLHELDTGFSNPWCIPIKPTLAGVRVLSLDGGGIRGVVELELLLRIEKELGGRIPIQEFFDLIVGTSTGGIIAIALGVEGWPVRRCISTYITLCNEAFTNKLGGRFLTTRKYKTKPLEECLKDSFKSEYLFGGPHDSSRSYLRKVAVTATSEAGDTAVIITNYNRPREESGSYRLERPDEPSHEMELWEAARATSAAPTFFRPFVNSRTKKAYLDGALFHNCPVRIAYHESKLIWPDVQDRHPDILLSLGTGHNGRSTSGFVDTTRQESWRKQLRDSTGIRNQPRKLRLTKWSSLLSILSKRVDNLLDTEQIWRSFKQDVIGQNTSVELGRYERISPSLGVQTPQMDDKGEIHTLQRDVTNLLDNTINKKRIQRVACRLFASCFYFQRTVPVRETEDLFYVHGTIRCRFSGRIDYIRSMGQWLRSHQRRSFQPCFRILEVNHESNAQDVILTPTIISRMINLDDFDLPPIVIPVSPQLGVVSIQLHVDQYSLCTFPISGFPRNLAIVEPTKPPASPKPPSVERLASPPRLPIRKRRAAHAHSVTSSPHGSTPTIPEDPPAYSSAPASSVLIDASAPQGSPAAFGGTAEGSAGPSSARASLGSQEGVNDWAQRRAAASIPPLRPSQPLSGLEIKDFGGSSTMTGFEDEDEGLTMALEQSLVDEMQDLEADVLANVLEMSKLDT